MKSVPFGPYAAKSLLVVLAVACSLLAAPIRCVKAAVPVIESISPTTGPTQGGIDLTLTGTGFFSSGASVTVGGAVCAVTSQGDTHVVCILPEGQGRDLPVVVTVGGQTSNSVSFSYDAPEIHSISPTKGPAQGGIDLTLVGTNLGASGASVTVGGAGCPVSSQSHSQVTCTLPAGQGSNQPVMLVVGGQTSNSVPFSYQFLISLPLILHSPTFAALRQG
jgi:hypothetical protein